MQLYGVQIVQVLGLDVCLIEYGSGYVIKIDILLQYFVVLVVYVLVEILFELLCQSVQCFIVRFLQVLVQFLCVDFIKGLCLLVLLCGVWCMVIYFFGFIIGNFDVVEVVMLLCKMCGEMGESGGILIGVDFKKDVVLLEVVYNDVVGVIVEFIFNMLVYVNCVIGSDFNFGCFCYCVCYNLMVGCIEMYIVFIVEQSVSVGCQLVCFCEGEVMQVEYSCKYLFEDFVVLVYWVGLEVCNVWFDFEEMFSV